MCRDPAAAIGWDSSEDVQEPERATHDEAVSAPKEVLLGGTDVESELLCVDGG